ncbi:hypothetical protein J1G42_03005 [Cellulomonas sp. zg-ZUI222]|uniref:hypothetical protein n=1 Tax=Cellulomonas wangleii TaxID=2816956 RepID=UPI001A94E6E7|nr:hypothetical protein [Cellulomonas wangleii]MBO0919794.1 hypothetical protein [Cellulomonas wangleii]
MPDGDIDKDSKGPGTRRARVPRKTRPTPSGSARANRATGPGAESTVRDTKQGKSKVHDDAETAAPTKQARTQKDAGPSNATVKPSKPPVPRKARVTGRGSQDAVRQSGTPVDAAAEPQPAASDRPPVETAVDVPVAETSPDDPVADAGDAGVPSLAAEDNVERDSRTLEAAPACGEDDASQPPPDAPQQASASAHATDPTELEALVRELRDAVSHLRGTADLRSQTDLALAAVVQQQQAMVVRLHQAARRAQSVEVLRHMVMQFLRETHIRVVTSIEDAALFPGVGPEGTWEVVEPAYVDGQTGRLVQPGTAARVDDVKTDDEETR